MRQEISTRYQADQAADFFNEISPNTSFGNRRGDRLVRNQVDPVCDMISPMTTALRTLHHVPGRHEELGDCDKKISAINGYLSPKEEAVADDCSNLESSEPTLECA